MASKAGGETLSLRHGVRCVPENGEQVEEVLLVVGEQVGCENIYSASQMNKAVVIFLKKEIFANTLSESGIWLKGVMLHVTPLSAPATRVVVSNVPPFIKDELILKELACFGKFAGPMTDNPLCCKNSAVKHVLSFRRQVYMLINNGEQTLDINFKCKVGDSSYTIFATTERLKCFGCGEIGHKRLSCPRRVVQPGSSGGDTAGAQQQQRGDSQQGDTGEQEHGADGGNDIQRSQQEEVSDEHTTTEKNTAPSDSTDTRVHDSNADSVHNKPYTAITVGDSDSARQQQKNPLDKNIENNKGELETTRGVEQPEHFYTTDQLNWFLEQTLGQSGVVLKNYFPDREKFIKSVKHTTTGENLNVLSPKRHFRLRIWAADARREEESG